MSSLDDIDEKIRRQQQARAALLGNLAPDASFVDDAHIPHNPSRAALGAVGAFDKDIYQLEQNRYEGYVDSIDVNDNANDDDDDGRFDERSTRLLSSFTAPKHLLEERMGPENGDPFSDTRRKTIAEREDEYHARRRNLIISPERHDPFAQEPAAASARTYTDVMKEHQLSKQKEEILKKLQKKKEEVELAASSNATTTAAVESSAPVVGEKRSRRRWDSGPGDSIDKPTSEWENSNGMEPPTVKSNRWDTTPLVTSGSIGSNIEETPRRQRSRWDETPQIIGGAHSLGDTPLASANMATPLTFNVGGMAPDQLAAARWEQELDVRNRPLTDEDLDEMFPSDGYEIIDPPAGYEPINTPSRKLAATPAIMAGTPLYSIPIEDRNQKFDVPMAPESDLPPVRPEEMQFFGALFSGVADDSLSAEEQRSRRIMRLLLKIKNGTPPQRKVALRQLTDRAREFGAKPLFDQVLPLLMSPTLEDQERHLLVKVIDRILYKLDDLVRPYVHKILVVIEPLLIDEDYYTRVEGREIISNLAKAAGVATMIATMRPDIDHLDEYVRNTTARAFAVVASALGVPTLLPFLKAVCQSRKSWQARHTGMKVIQQIAIMMGCAILPHLTQLVEIIAHGIKDEQQTVRTITALALAALAEASHPYGSESFAPVLVDLSKGIHQYNGKGLAAFLKAVGYIIPLMEPEHASSYTRDVMPVLLREFQSPDEEMKKIVLKVVKQCVGTEGVEPQYVREEILPEYFRNFWIRRMAMDKRNYKQVVETTVGIAVKVGVSIIITRIVNDLKDENENYRRMVMETIEQIITDLGASDVDPRLEEQLIDGILYAFQEQDSDNSTVILSGFGTIVNALGHRVKTYLPQICGTIMWRLKNKAATVRMQAADLITRIAVVMSMCGEDTLLAHLGVVLYEYLGEEYPEVLGSILGALKAVVNVIGMTNMKPPIKDLLPRLTPILKNRHEKVLENCIDLVGRIADRGAEYVSKKEWNRICFELLDVLKAQRKGIRRAAVNTFGYIARAIGPHDVLATLLNNLKVQERQNRVCTTVAIAIVAETCSAFTVLPALMNEYRVPEVNVQNGVLKALAFMFEYIGEMGKDYVYSVCPLLEDALIDRDMVHRQTACVVVKHMALGSVGLGVEDAMLHLLNYVWPNIFETSPHVINAVMEAIEGIRVCVGSSLIFQYIVQGLFHPARRVRDVYWKLYNTLYVASQSALVPVFPRLKNDGKNTFERPELDLFI